MTFQHYKLKNIVLVQSVLSRLDRLESSVKQVVALLTKNEHEAENLSTLLPRGKKMETIAELETLEGRLSDRTFRKDMVCPVDQDLCKYILTLNFLLSHLWCDN